MIHNSVSIFKKYKKAKGAYKPISLTNAEFDQAHMYVLQNYEEVWSFIK